MVIKWIVPLVIVLAVSACGQLVGPNKDDLAVAQVMIEEKLTQTAVALATSAPTQTPAPTATSTSTATPIIPPTPIGGGGQIAFASNQDGNFNIYVIDHMGDGLRQVTTWALDDNEPAWSPDGTHLVYTSWPDIETQGLYVIASDGADRRFIAKFPQAKGGSPTWSIKGRIAYWATTCTSFCNKNGYNRSVIYFIDEDGGNLETVQPYIATIPYDPSWSPDGRRLAILRGTEWHTGIEIVTTDGERQQSIHEFTRYQERDPAYSPDGSILAYSSDEKGDFDIYIYYLDGTYETRLTSSSGDDRHPTWSPDGTQLAFTSNRNGNWDIYVINIDGIGEHPLTTAAADEIEPSWGPAP